MAKVTGEGTIVQLEKDKPKSKCRKWQLRVPVGLDPRTGKYKTRTRRFNGTYTEAKKALREFIKEIENDEVHKRSGTTIKECAEDFMTRRRASGEFTENTNVTYERFFKAINRHIGYADASKVTRETLEKMYAAMRSGDTLSGKPASGTYLNQIHKTLKLLFDDLVKDGVVSKNPCTEMDTPRRDTQPRRALKPEAIREFIAQLDFTQEADIAYFLAVSTGMRRGEVCGLSWRDVDLESRVISIRKSYDCFGNLKDPKTKAGVRRLPMPDSVRDALLVHKDAQKARIDAYATEQERLAKKNGEKPGKRLERSESTPVVLSTTMGRLSPNVLEAWWLRDRERLGLDGWAFHELRHSYLSTLALRGVHPKVMQELAGHASSEITMEIYTHVNMEAKRAAADVVSDLFSEPVEAIPAATPIVQVEPRVINGGRRLTLVSSPRERMENAPESTSEQPQERFVPDSYQAATH